MTTQTSAGHCAHPINEIQYNSVAELAIVTATAIATLGPSIRCQTRAPPRQRAP
jgi:hypothetical protein